MPQGSDVTQGDHASHTAWLPVGLAFLLLAAVLLPVLLMRGKSATFDEVAHLPAGYAYLTTGTLALNPQHPPLIKQLCALPLLAMRLHLPAEAARLQQPDVPLTWQWTFGKRFLFSQDADRILFWGRVPAVLLSGGLAVLVALWAGRLWGSEASLLAVALYVFDPTITAHAQLVATDVGLACFASLFLYLLRRYLERPSVRLLVATGIALGLALGTKFSAIALLPMAALLIGLAAWNERGSGLAPARSRGRRYLVAAAAGIALLGIAYAVLWGIYFFPDDAFFYLKGLRLVNRDHDPLYHRYLMGDLRLEGWRSYLLIAWLVKTPLPSLLLLAGAVVCFLRGHRAHWLDEAFLIVPALGLFVGYSLNADNIGVRYLIPCMPFLYIFTARLWPVLQPQRWGKGLLVAMVLWLVAEYVMIWPDHLSYFNQVTGGSHNGYRWLDDSNLDWGQGLMQLRSYLEKQPIDEYRFCYFGSGDPAYYGLHGKLVTIRDLFAPPPPGMLILSAHCFARLRAVLTRFYGQGGANWLAHAEIRELVGHAYYIVRVPGRRGAGRAGSRSRNTAQAPGR